MNRDYDLLVGKTRSILSEGNGQRALTILEDFSSRKGVSFSVSSLTQYRFNGFSPLDLVIHLEEGTLGFIYRDDVLWVEIAETVARRLLRKEGAECENITSYKFGEGFMRVVSLKDEGRKK